MANVEERTLTLVFGTTKNYFSGSGLYIDYQGWSQQPMAIWGSKNGTATMKDAGKAVLYPKAGVHPFKADLSMIGATSVDDATMKIYFDGVEVFNDWWYNNSQEETKLVENLTNECILNSTINSSITVNLSASQTKLLGGFGMRNNSYFKLYFQQWDLIGQKVGDGRAVIISPGRLYAGESGTFRCIVGNGSTFHGWYSDSNHTQLVSNSMTYTTIASQDLTLYAYVTQDLNIIDDLYFKSRILYYDGSVNYTSIWKKPISYYLKTINGWERKTDKNSINKNMDYILHINENCIKIYASGGNNVTSQIVYKPYPHIIFYKTTNSRDIILDFSSSNNHYSICPMEDGFGILFDGIYYTGTSTVTIISTNTSSLSSKNTYTLTCSLTTETKTIYFIDKNGNPFTETFTNNQPYTVTTPTGYTNFTGWREYYNGTATGRVLTVGNSYYDVGDNKAIHYEPVFSS